MDTTGSGRRAYIGSFTSAGGRGIVTAAVDAESGALTPLHTTDAVGNPSYLVPAPDGRHLYAVSETSDGAAAAFTLTERGPELLGGPVPVRGSDPTHLALWAGHLLTANYSSGSVSALPVRADGSLAEPAAVLRHEGDGPHPDRQEGPHAHAVVPEPAGRRLLSVDLGTDSVRVCELAAAGGELAVRHEVPLRPGSGPRHLAFHPRGGHAYVVNELASTVTPCRWDAGTGTLTPLTETAILPPDMLGDAVDNYPSELVVSHDGRFAWAANRGHDSISVLAIDPSGERITLVTTVPCGGHWPRDLALHPGGRYLYAANERSGDVTWFAIDTRTGMPERGGAIEVPAASCVVFV
ncbi:lactonase family protein [Streptomyces sp. NPDC018019]|uniref:lactonase family protein n=1 Tax=Streptomyces sp. NPDC018019 TaxID=3365030 RepID=UPI0037BD2B63